MLLLRDHRRVLLLSALAAGALCLAAVLALDGPAAVACATLSPQAIDRIQAALGLLERTFAFGVSPYLYGALLVAGGLTAFGWARARLTPWALLFVGLTHGTARFLADILKPPFSRLRPYEALGPDGWHDTWFAPVGNAFPSGHAVHFWSLFFPLAVLFPRWRLPLAVLPLLVSAARVSANDHYPSDIFGSVAIAALVTWAYAGAVLERGLTPTP